MELKYFNNNDIPQMIRIYTLIAQEMYRMGCQKTTIAYLTQTKPNDVDWAIRKSFPLQHGDKDFARKNVHFFKKYLGMES